MTRRARRSPGLFSIDSAAIADAEAPSPTAGGPALLRVVGGSAVVPAGDPARERRVKALATTAPIHDMQANKSMRPGWDVYDLYDLALATIDLVVDRMSFDSGILRAELDELVALDAARFAPDAKRTQHRDVALYVISALIDPQVSGYHDATDGRRRRFDFRLLDEVEGGAGIYLRATKEAINVLVGALDTDLESAHAAAEARLANLIRRKKLPDAAQAARDARYRSVQFMLEVQRLIADTRRDIRQADWAEAIPRRLREMLEHLDERTSEEQKMLAAMREARDEAEDERLERQAAELVATVEECYTRHTELHVRIMEAEAAFFEEQDRQSFAPPPSLRTVDLTDELLTPLLLLPINLAESIAMRFVMRVWGPQPPITARWGSAVAHLLQPPPARELLGEPVDEPEWDDPIEDPRRFDDHAWFIASQVLDLDPTAPPVRLSVLVERAQRAGEDGLAAELVRLRAMIAISPAFSQLRPGGESVLAAAADGATLGAASGLWGDNLLVGALAPGDDLLPIDEVESDWRAEQLVLPDPESVRRG